MTLIEAKPASQLDHSLWASIALRHATLSIKDGTHGSFERVATGVPLLSAKNIHKGYVVISDSESLICESDAIQINASGNLRPGDLLLTIVGTIGRAAIFQGGHVCFQRSVAMVRPSQRLDVSYLYYYSQSAEFQSELHSRAKQSAQSGIYLGDLAAIPIPLPPQERQQTIAIYLERKTARIDELIEKKRCLIELLQEKRQALITHAVTKGLDPHAPKDDWTTGQLGRFIKLQRGIDITGASERECGIPVYSSGGLSGYSETAMAIGPGVIVGRKGTLGTVHYAESDYWPHDTTLWVKNFRGSHPRYVYYFLLHMKLERLDVGAANPTLNRNHVHPQRVNWPPLNVQVSVAKYLDQASLHSDVLVEKNQGLIDRLQEYRQALISAAVTGKIDLSEESA